MLQTKLGEPNKAEAEAVDARQELDLKVQNYYGVYYLCKYYCGQFHCTADWAHRLVTPTARHLVARDTRWTAHFRCITCVFRHALLRVSQMCLQSKVQQQVLAEGTPA